MAEHQVLAFGDLHLNWQAGRHIFNVARAQNINHVISLGDEAHKIYPFATGDEQHYELLFDELFRFADEDASRQLVCVAGDKTAGVPPELLPNFVGVSDDGRMESSAIYRNGNIIAGHSGKWIVEEYGDFIEEYNGDEPLVIFHGHSHYIGVLPVYKWLDDHEKAHFIPEGEVRVTMEPGDVYWVNPGGNYFEHEGLMLVNYAIYDRSEQTISLRSDRVEKFDVFPPDTYLTD